MDECLDLSPAVPSLKPCLACNVPEGYISNAERFWRRLGSFGPCKFSAMFGCNAQKIAVISHFFNAAAIASLITSLVTDQWLLSEERIPDRSYSTLTSSGIRPRNVSYSIRHTHNGFWTFCQQDPHQSVDCFWIEHDIPDHSHVDPRNATTCILYATMISMPSLLSAVSVTVLGILANALIKCRKIWIFIAGIIYIVAGICTFTCIVLFITYVIQELEHKEEEKLDGEAVFTSAYGYSTYLAMISFCCQELGGISLIYLSVSRFNKHWAEKDRRQAEHYRQQYGEPSFTLAGGRDSQSSRHHQRTLISPNGSLSETTYNSATWNGRLAEHYISSEHQQRSLSANVSPAAMTRKYMTSMNPDLGVRTHDVHVGGANSIRCTYDNNSFMTPFPLALRSRDYPGQPQQQPSPRLHMTQKGLNHRYQPVATSSSRQVTFSVNSVPQDTDDLEHDDSTGHINHQPFRKHHTGSRRNSSSRRKNDWRMTPV